MVDHRDTVDKTSVFVILRDAWGRQMLKKYFDSGLVPEYIFQCNNFIL